MTSLEVRPSERVVPLMSDRCPRCEVSLVGDSIPEVERAFLHGETHRRRERGWLTDDYEGVLYWSCPDCGWAWSGWVGGLGPGSLTALADAHVEEHNARLRDDWFAIRQRVVDRADAISRLYLEHAGLRPTGWRGDPGRVRVDVRTEWVAELEEPDVEVVEAIAGDLIGIEIHTALAHPDRVWTDADFDRWPTVVDHPHKPKNEGRSSHA